MNRPLTDTEKLLRRALVATDHAFREAIERGSLSHKDYVAGTLAHDLRAHCEALGIPLDDTRDDVVREFKRIHKNRLARLARAK